LLVVRQVETHHTVDTGDQSRNKIKLPLACCKLQLIQTQFEFLFKLS